MNRKAVFLDVDGTLVNDRGLVPASAADAVRAARANGHLVFLSTGRAMVAVFPQIREVGFDGFITAAGAYVECDGAVLAHHCLPEGLLGQVQEYLAARGIEYFLESSRALFGSAAVRHRLTELLFGGIAEETVRAEVERGLAPFLDTIRPLEALTPDSVHKVVLLGSSVPIEEVTAEFATRLHVIPGSVPMFGANSGEMGLPGVHKASGIDVITDYLGLDRRHTIALGDGANDVEMLAHAAVGIAMGNAPAAVKLVADEVTGTPDEGGVAAAFRRHGLLEPVTAGAA